MLFDAYEHVTVLFDVDASASENVHVGVIVTESPLMTPLYVPNVQLADVPPSYVLLLHVGAPPVIAFLVTVNVAYVFVNV